MKISAIRVNQWMPEWDSLDFDPDQNQARPQKYFLVFSLKASILRRLSGIYRREATSPRSEDLGIQRRHDPERSAEISRYVRHGYPYSTLSAAKRGREENDALKKPGWLPTAVVVNILAPEETRRGQSLKEPDAITVEEHASGVHIMTLPDLEGAPGREVFPIEVIDGQHRLYAFDDDAADLDYELPVVAFINLDIAWQAYLFWTINIKPKKINASLAFDLYPLLREQSWLDAGDVLEVYRESRAQELTEILWSYPESPWYRRINMLGGDRKQNGPVTQAAFIRSLVASMVKSWRPRNGIGGIFGGTPDRNTGLAWTRRQQAAFLVEAWRLLAEAVGRTDAPWAEAIRSSKGTDDDPTSSHPFAGSGSLLATDQGVRGFQSALNDYFYLHSAMFGLRNWQDGGEFRTLSPDIVVDALRDLQAQEFHKHLVAITESLAKFDWRTSSGPGLDERERLEKQAFRGSSGYRALRNQLVKHLEEHGLTFDATLIDDRS